MLIKYKTVNLSKGLKFFIIACICAIAGLPSCTDTPLRGDGTPLAIGHSPAQVQEQAPWRLTARLISPRQANTEQISKTTPATGQQQVPSSVVTLQLRLQSQDLKTSIQTLFQAGAEELSSSQQQTFLLYHMDEVAYIQVGSTRVRPVAAIVEMTPQRTEYLDIDFTFALSLTQVRQQAEVLFVLEPNFFLSRPVEFSFASSQLLAPAL